MKDKLTKRPVETVLFMVAFRLDKPERVQLDDIRDEIIAALNAAKLAGTLSISDFIVGFDPDQGD